MWAHILNVRRVHILLMGRDTHALRRLLVFVMLYALGVASGVMYGYIKTTPIPVAFVPSRSLSRDGTTVAETHEAPRVSQHTEVLYHIYYEACGHETVEVLDQPAGAMVGLDLERLRLLYPDWQVCEFSSARLSLRQVVPAMCADDSRYRLITIRDGAVIVLHGSGLHDDSPVLAMTAIREEHLTEQELELLKKGIVVNSDQEAMDWLEGVLE